MRMMNETINNVTAPYDWEAIAENKRKRNIESSRLYRQRHREEISKRRKIQRQRQNPENRPRTNAERNRDYRERRKQEIEERKKRIMEWIAKEQGASAEGNTNNTDAIEQAPQNSNSSNDTRDLQESATTLEIRSSASSTIEIALQLPDSTTAGEVIEFEIDNEVIDLSDTGSDATGPKSNVIASKKLKLSDVLSCQNPPIVALDNWFSLRWRCFLCTFFSCDYTELLRHYESYHQIAKVEDIFYQCSDCDTVVQCYASFLNHVRFLHHPELKTSCDACSIHFSVARDLAEHRESFHHVEVSTRPEVFYCSLCERAYATKAELTKHQEVHAFICEICQNEFEDLENLERHKTSHSMEGHCCAVCHQSFKTVLDLEEHLHEHFDGGRRGQIKCRFCDETFTTCLRRQLHERSHVGLQYFQCKQCSQQFPDGVSLELFQKHLRSHAEGQHKCEKCPKTFKQLSRLRDHLMRHKTDVSDILADIYKMD